MIPTGMLDSYLLNVEQNRFNKLYRAKTPRAQRKIFSYFSELGVLCGSTVLTTLS
jgi:hypothetical protein